MTLAQEASPGWTLWSMAEIFDPADFVKACTLYIGAGGGKSTRDLNLNCMPHRSFRVFCMFTWDFFLSVLTYVLLYNKFLYS